MSGDTLSLSAFASLPGGGLPDTAGLDLQALSSGTREEKIQRVAVQFEEMLLQTLLKTMEQSRGEDEASASLGVGMGSWSGLRTMVMSQYLADAGGFGYQEIIRRQIAEKSAGGAAQETSAKGQAAAGFSIDSSHPVPPAGDAVTSPFGWRDDPLDGTRRFHHGIDFRLAPDTPVRALADGKVVFSGWKPGYGNIVELQHDNGLVTRYAHNSSLSVQVGQAVRAGGEIARSGSSGRSTGPHLHLEVLQDQKPVDPEKIFGRQIAKVFQKSSELKNELV